MLSTQEDAGPQPCWGMQLAVGKEQKEPAAPRLSKADTTAQGTLTRDSSCSHSATPACGCASAENSPPYAAATLQASCRARPQSCVHLSTCASFVTVSHLYIRQRGGKPQLMKLCGFHSWT
jgi:hypothetical protein